ncbi:hypothetical protein ACH4PU_02580 [Streptomyces sp. NPDC021100]|uniref:hypothetical protein n=1 Tax=Streptomyces sp. NPDC021100 TaxID=3365114 RepID=UPI0037B69813
MTPVTDGPAPECPRQAADAFPDETGPDKTGPDKTGPDKTGLNKAGPDTRPAGQDR